MQRHLALHSISRIFLCAQIYLITNIALEVGRHKAQAMLILVTVGCTMKNSANATLPLLLSFGRAHNQANLETELAVVPALLQFREEFRETEILGDLPRHW
jgi:hypothetical protein